MRNFRLDLSYDGSRYRGWQRQGNTGATIQAKLEDTLSRILDQPVEVHGAGRTDAGVHALQQTASFHADTALSCSEILTQLRAFLPEDIGANALSEAPPRFHARLSCIGKTYRYRIRDDGLPCVFERKYVWQLPEPLDDEAMARAASALCGTHDFSAFRTGRSKKSAVRRLDRIEFSRSGGELSIIIASPLLTTADNSSQLLSDLTAALAKVMLSSLEDCDSLARNADGDPIAILPGTGYVKSRHIAEQLQKDFSKSAMPIHAGASCAIGIVSISKEEKSAAELLTRAETALIEAKTLQSHIRQIGPEYIEDRSTLVHSDEKRFLFFGR